MNIQAFIFDLDGVITDTARYHYHAWKWLANELNIEFSEKDNETIKGVDRKASLEWIVKKGGLSKTDLEKNRLAEAKNKYYQTLISDMSPNNILPGVQSLLKELQKRQFKIGLASASKNAFFVLEQLKLTHYFDYIADANRIQNGKPHPEIFLTVAEALKINPAHCIGIEDASVGIKAIKAAGMLAIGVGCANKLSEADLVFSSLVELDLGRLTKHRFNPELSY